MMASYKYIIMCKASSSLRRLVLLLLLVISAESASAQLTLGYCDEEGYTGSLTNSSTEATISCAMGLTPALQADYTFCSISYLRILLTAPENLTSFRVWLRKDLNDVEDLSAIDIEPSALVEGWNDIALPDSIRLTTAFACRAPRPIIAAIPTGRAPRRASPSAERKERTNRSTFRQEARGAT